MCVNIILIYLRYGNINRLNSCLLVIDFALYYCLTVHFVVGVFKIPVK